MLAGLGGVAALAAGIKRTLIEGWVGACCAIFVVIFGAELTEHYAR